MVGCRGARCGSFLAAAHQATARLVAANEAYAAVMFAERVARIHALDWLRSTGRAIVAIEAEGGDPLVELAALCKRAGDAAPPAGGEEGEGDAALDGPGLTDAVDDGGDGAPEGEGEGGDAAAGGDPPAAGAEGDGDEPTAATGDDDDVADDEDVDDEDGEKAKAAAAAAAEAEAKAKADEDAAAEAALAGALPPPPPLPEPITFADPVSLLEGLRLFVLEVCSSVSHSIGRRFRSV